MAASMLMAASTIQLCLDGRDGIWEMACSPHSWLSEGCGSQGLQPGELIPAEDQDHHEPVRFLKKRHFFTQAGVIISLHEKYADELVQPYGLQHRKPKAAPDVMGENFESEELHEQGKHRFSLGVLLGYNTANKSKLSEIHGKADPGELTTDLVEVFTDADWAGDKSTGTRRRHSVSSAMVYVNGRLVTAWSRTQKSIALSSCESECLAAVGGGAEAIYISALWEFITHRPTSARIVSDSSSCRAFSHRQGVGRLKHINVKYLWLQQKIKEGALEMDGVPTVLKLGRLGHQGACKS
eukprot:s4552_g3.t1